MSGSPGSLRRSRTIRSSLLRRFEKQDARPSGKMTTPLTPEHHQTMIAHSDSDLASAKTTASSEITPTPTSSFKPLPQSPSLTSSTSDLSLNASVPSTTTNSPRHHAQIEERVGESRPATLPARLPPSLDASASPPPLRISKSSNSPATASPPPPLRVIEDDDHPLRAAILRNAAFLFPEYALDQLSIATGMTPADAFMQQNAFALVFASEVTTSHGGPSGKPQRAVRELAKSPMGCTSRRRALEGLLRVCEFAIGTKVMGPQAYGPHRTGGGGDGTTTYRTRHFLTGDGLVMPVDGAVDTRIGLNRMASKTASSA